MLTKDEDGCSEMFVMKTHLKCEPLLGISNVCRFEKNIDVTERERILLWGEGGGHIRVHCIKLERERERR